MRVVVVHGERVLKLGRELGVEVGLALCLVVGVLGFGGWELLLLFGRRGELVLDYELPKQV